MKKSILLKTHASSNVMMPCPSLMKSCNPMFWFLVVGLLVNCLLAQELPKGGPDTSCIFKLGEFMFYKPSKFRKMTNQ